MKLAARILTLATTAAVALGLSGCATFFDATSSSSSSSSSGSATDNGNYIYVANGNATLDGYGLASGVYGEIANMPLSLTYTPVALATTPSNSYLYVAGAANSTNTDTEGIYGFSIGSAGALTSIDSGDLLSDGVTFASIGIDPGGNFIVALAADFATVYVYQIQSNGTLASLGALATTHSSGSTAGTAAIAFAPSDDYVYIANNNGGITVYSFDGSTTDGSGGNMQQVGYVAGTTATSYNDLATASISGTDYLFAAISGTGAGVTTYKINSDGSISGSNTAAGSAPYKLAYNSTSNTLYSVDKSGSAVYSFSFNGTLTSVGNYTTNSTPIGVSVDTTGGYVNVLSNGSGSLQDYTISTTTAGQLTSLNSQTLSGSSPNPQALAATHAD